MMYTYRAIKENAVTGERAKYSQLIQSVAPLSVGCLFSFPGKKGLYRILEVVEGNPGIE